MKLTYQGTLSQQQQHRHDQRERIRLVVLNYKALENTPAALAAWEKRLRRLKSYSRIMDMATGQYVGYEGEWRTHARG